MGAVIGSELEGDTLTIRVLVNRLDAAAAPGFKSAVEEVWQDSIKSLVIDVNSIEFIDSSGVGALLSVYKRLKSGNEGVKLTNVQPPVQTVIELLRLHRIFEIDPA